MNLHIGALLLSFATLAVGCAKPPPAAPMTVDDLSVALLRDFETTGDEEHVTAQALTEWLLVHVDEQDGFSLADIAAEDVAAMPYDGGWAVAGFPCPVGVGSSTISFAVQCRSNGNSGLTRLHQRITASILSLPLTNCNRTPLGVRIWAAQQGSRGCGDRARRRFWGRRCGRDGPVSCLRVRMCFVIRTLRNGRGLTVIGGPGAQSVADRENVIDTHHRV